MKIKINFDLIEKAQEAKTGFSLNKYKRAVGICTGIMCSVTSLTVLTGAQTLLGCLRQSMYAFTYYCLYFGVSLLSRKGYSQIRANEQLEEITPKLKNIFVDTDPELLKDTQCYETQYSMDSENSKIPRIMQKKYINVPVHSDWDNNQRSLVQEHIIGTHEYFLSHGEPEKKVLTLGKKQMLQK